VTSRPAVFIDRDGTLTEEVGHVNHPSRLQLLPRAGEAIRRLNAANAAAVLVARGHFSESVLRAVDEPLHAPLARAGARLDGLDAVDRVSARPVAA
jgi:D-glycero-D-manno-heptose 1,7-bisphosphate phosphatase